MIHTRLTYPLIPVLVAATADAAQPAPGSLQARLLDEGIAALAQAAMETGDAQRGAVAFPQPTLACGRCHSTNGKPGAIGPDLATWPKQPTTAELVESILDPSRTIRRGFETAVVVRTDGRQILGLLVEASERAVVLPNPTTGETTTIPADEIEEWTKTTQSSMPADVVNQLGTRQQFLDLVPTSAKFPTAVRTARGNCSLPPRCSSPVGCRVRSARRSRRFDPQPRRAGVRARQADL